MKNLIWTFMIALTGMIYLGACTEFEKRTEPMASGETETPVMAVAKISPLTSQEVSGTITFQEEGDYVEISGTVEGLSEGKHGFHVHTGTSCDEPGGHFAPENAEHGAPSETEHHVGDLGNLVADSTGVAHYDFTVPKMALHGSESLVGHALIVHQGEDDYLDQPSGESGTKIGCGIIEIEQN